MLHIFDEFLISLISYLLTCIFFVQFLLIKKTLKNKPYYGKLKEFSSIEKNTKFLEECLLEIHINYSNFPQRFHIPFTF